MQMSGWNVCIDGNRSGRTHHAGPVKLANRKRYALVLHVVLRARHTDHVALLLLQLLVGRLLLERFVHLPAEQILLTVQQILGTLVHPLQLLAARASSAGRATSAAHPGHLLHRRTAHGQHAGLLADAVQLLAIALRRDLLLQFGQLALLGGVRLFGAPHALLVLDGVRVP